MAVLTSTSVTGVTDLSISGALDGVLKDYVERRNTIGSTTATTTINLANGQFVTATLAVNTTFVFTIGGKAGTSGTNATSFTLVLTNDATAGRTIVWPGAVKWANGVPPTRTTAANRTDVYTFFTFDNGTTWWGALSLFNYA